MNFWKNVLFVDGVAGVGKTHYVKRKNGLLLDYAERIEKTPLYKSKHKNSFMQTLYTTSFMLEILHKIQYNPFQQEQQFIVDRSPITDIFYDMIIKDNYENLPLLIKMCKEDPLINSLNIVFIVPTTPKQKTDIHHKMVERNNAIDIMSYDYVEKQSKLFQEFAINVFPKSLLLIPPYIEMYTEDHYNFIEYDLERRLYPES